MQLRQPISESIRLLKRNVKNTKSVKDWAALMGYSCPGRFARFFEKYYEVRPYAVLKYYRLVSISKALRENNQSNLEIARCYSIVDEIALNKYINYHLDYSPTDLKKMSDNKMQEVFKNLVVKLGIENAH